MSFPGHLQHEFILNKANSRSWPTHAWSAFIAIIRVGNVPQTRCLGTNPGSTTDEISGSIRNCHYVVAIEVYRRVLLTDTSQVEADGCRRDVAYVRQDGATKGGSARCTPQAAMPRMPGCNDDVGETNH